MKEIHFALPLVIDDCTEEVHFKRIEDFVSFNLVLETLRFNVLRAFIWRSIFFIVAMTETKERLRLFVPEGSCKSTILKYLIII